MVKEMGQSRNGKFFTGKKVKCCWCGKSIYRKPSLLKRSKFHACSKSCLSQYNHTGSTPWNKGKKLHYKVWNKGIQSPLRMEKHPGWKGGIKIGYNGYVIVRRYRKDCLQHRIIAEIKIGRKLRKGEVVHHIDENKTNNDPNNLMVFSSSSEHIRTCHHTRKKRQ